jgi:hypothetical protein
LNGWLAAGDLWGRRTFCVLPPPHTVR